MDPEQDSGRFADPIPLSTLKFVAIRRWALHLRDDLRLLR